MPPVDLETLVTACTGNDHKIARETAAESSATKNFVIPDEHIAGDVEPDFPPESFWISKDAEYDWFDRNAVYERKESTKGNSNSNNTINSSINNSNSQRSSVMSKASIIGLPKTQKNTFVDSKWKTSKVVNTRLFPKPERPAVPEAEPGSPKVSCMGRVRSKRSRRLSNSLKTKEKQAEKLGTCGEEQKPGFCFKIMCIFRSKKGHKNPTRSGSGKVVEVPEEEPSVVEPRRKSVSLKEREIPAGGETAAGPPGLGGMNRFSSGRRSGNWTADEINRAI